MVSCPHGRIYLVVLDVREKTPDFGKWESFILSPETGTQVLIPPYFAIIIGIVICFSTPYPQKQVSFCLI
jgi:dTDP-4-dehydrorhamnose 3,5-epimerase-like enzyme